MTYSLLRQIPKVDGVLKSAGWEVLVSSLPENIAKDVLREYLDSLRLAIRRGNVMSVPSIDDIIETVKATTMTLVAPGFKKVVNATGIVIHTNLGRSILSKKAIDAIVRAAGHYSNLEYDIEKGVRGSRYTHCSSVLKRLAGAEEALVVNNNAAAVFLAINTLAEGKEVIISRGELIEIGGSFRIPDVMRKSGAILREVGTTNRTHIEDYERAINDNTALIMKAHPSNYRIRGFTHEASSEELAALGRRYGITTFFDAGSGLLYPLKGLGLLNEPVIPVELRKGFDVISFSGDKLLGATQAGIIVGNKECLEAMKKNPMARALRPDKFTLAGLESTLLIYMDRMSAEREIPTVRMILEDRETLKKRAKRLAFTIRKRCPGVDITVVEIDSEVGGGSFPDMAIPSAGISLKGPAMTVDSLEKSLRNLAVPVLGRIESERLILDMRTVLEEDEADLLAGLTSVLGDGG